MPGCLKFAVYFFKDFMNMNIQMGHSFHGTPAPPCFQGAGRKEKLFFRKFQAVLSGGSPDLDGWELSCFKTKCFAAAREFRIPCYIKITAFIAINPLLLLHDYQPFSFDVRKLP